MGFFTKIFNVTPKRDLKGLHLDYNSSYWEIEGDTDYPKLFSALMHILPDDCILYFEGGSPNRNKRLIEFFSENAIPEKSHIAVSIYWPRPKYYHVPATLDNIKALIEISKQCAEYELAIHFHIYHNDKVLLEWHDAFSQPMFLSDYFTYEKVKKFTDILTMKFKKISSTKL